MSPILQCCSLNINSIKVCRNGNVTATRVCLYLKRLHSICIGTRLTPQSQLSIYDNLFLDKTCQNSIICTGYSCYDFIRFEFLKSASVKAHLKISKEKGFLFKKKCDVLKAANASFSCTCIWWYSIVILCATCCSKRTTIRLTGLWWFLCERSDSNFGSLIGW